MLDPSFTVVNGSSAGAFLVRCHGETLGVAARYGVGYTIPQAIAKLVNLFLRVFNARPIAASGGVFSGSTLFNRSETDPPNVPLCGT